jgi:hypothetical protein
MDDAKPANTLWSGSLLRIAVSVLVIVFLLNYLFLGGWPPAWVVRRDQRKMVVERIQASGGWAALQRASDALVETNRDSGFQWYYFGSSNALPPAIAALQPQEVWYYSPKKVRGSMFATDFDVVHIKVFGMHHTGARAIPYFGLEVVSGTNAARYTPRRSLGGVSGNGYDSYRKITDSIYEIYGPD